MAVLLNPEDSLSYVLTLDQAAAEVGKATATVRDWIRKGYLEPMRFKGKRRIYTTGRAVREAEARAWANMPRRTGHAA